MAIAVVVVGEELPSCLAWAWVVASLVEVAFSFVGNLLAYQLLAFVEPLVVAPSEVVVLPFGVYCIVQGVFEDPFSLDLC